ncbi:hypothetical protein M9H61_17550 [Thalassospira sp. GO-4]|jgi:hypothetical protein|uniref:hypothetical protein n=1 Tax=Thalassospira sp. GO-4 TaxID=2946605 RepID=UPI0020252F4F|nr:hypothetical protein [Thalassospira sp. GO-4]URK17338.1 hypothetical protein M9H61_17550 [Thalassospira sp. GO-4]
MSRKVRIALFPRNLSSLVEMRQQYEILFASQDFEPVFIVESEIVYQKLKSCGYGALRLPEVERQDQGHFKFVSRTRIGVFAIRALEKVFNEDYIRHNFLVGTVRLVLTIKTLRRMTNLALGLLCAEKIELLLLPGDRELGWIPPVIKACEELSIPTVISLTTMVPTDPSSELTQRSQHRKFHASAGCRTLFWNRIVRTFFPHHLSPDDHEKIFSPGWLVVALELMGMSSSNPWYQGMGRSNAIFVEGKRKLRRLAAGGVPERKLILSGSVALNDLVRDKPQKKLPLKIIVMVPSYAEQSLCDWNTHIKGVREMVCTVTQGDYEVILSLHPKSKLEDYIFLSEEFHCTISKEKFSEEMKNSDLCICSNSTTIEVSTILSIPVINYDYVNLNIRTWDDYRGVTVVREFRELIEEFSRITRDLSYYEFLCAEQKNMSEDILIRVDDFGAHFQEIIKEIIQGHRV